MGAKSGGVQDPQESDAVTTETWNDADCNLVVTQPEGWTCKVSLQTKIRIPPRELYELLTQPDNSKLFRSIKALRSRKVIEDDRRGRQVVKVEQEAQWRFLCFGGTFITKLLVNQNKRSGQIKFELTEPGPMKKFEGIWQIQPFNQETLDLNAGAKPRFRWPPNPLEALQGFRRRFTAQEEEEASLLTLEQSVLPNVVPPKPLDRLLKGIAARQVRNLVEDVRKEADRRLAAKEREKPHPSTSAAPLARLHSSRPLWSLILQPSFQFSDQHRFLLGTWKSPAGSDV